MHSIVSNLAPRSPRPKRPSRLLLGMAAWALLAAGCSGDTVAQADRTAAPTAVPAPAGSNAAGAELSLEVIDGGEATGLVITDYRGFAVYGLTGETPAALVCLDDCATAWVPLAPRDLVVADQLEADKLDLITRPDGTEQVVYDNVPLYLWTGDTEIGITGGAGVAGTWFALTETAGFIASE